VILAPLLVFSGSVGIRWFLSFRFIQTIPHVLKSLFALLRMSILFLSQYLILLEKSLQVLQNFGPYFKKLFPWSEIREL